MVLTCVIVIVNARDAIRSFSFQNICAAMITDTLSDTYGLLHLIEQKNSQDNFKLILKGGLYKSFKTYVYLALPKKIRINLLHKLLLTGKLFV